MIAVEKSFAFKNQFVSVWVVVKKKPQGSISRDVCSCDSLFLCHIKLVQFEATLSKTVHVSESLEPVLTRDMMTGTSPNLGCLINGY